MIANTPLLHLAIQFNRLDLVLWLLEKGTEPDRTDKHGRTALYFAADRRMARTLMQAGADPKHRDLLDHTPLHAAVQTGRLEVAHALTLAQVDLNAQDKRGHTPLHAAALKGRVKCVEHLIRQGANPNVQDRKGRHPLFYAVAG
ncbi:ankyrin repeat domain-containing protein, partial [Bradyrhizobium sp. NBAIM08]|uniref:ankyrin repeat domain-containing protein n=1 Tax=Bradyrhizobium sp. NBAIM08 TaxID=2793815 RepID=UPI0034D26F9A